VSRESSWVVKWGLLSPFAGLVTLLLGIASVAILTNLTAPRLTEKRSVKEASVQWPHRVDVENRETKIGDVEKAKTYEPKVTQSKIVNFPRLGAVRVQTIEQVGEFPQIVFADAKSRKVIFRRQITDPDGSLKPNDDEFAQPFLRFGVVHSEGISTPLIMAVAVRPGGSDHLFTLVVFGALNGKMAPLSNVPIETNIQGGFYFGFINRKLGYGIVSWCFDWDFDNSEGHYDYHHYTTDIYTMSGGRFRKIATARSRRKYGPANSYRAPRELGIRATDIRRKIPDLKEFVEADL
jgi:hypothetical protein